MRDLHVILPMAGRGSRFADAGFTTPKPLIDVDGQAMFMKALSSLDAIEATKHYTIIIREAHDHTYGLQTQLKAILPEGHIVVTDEQPTGALSDAYRAKPYLQPKEGIIILDCDLWFSSKPYYHMVESSLRDENPIAGGLLTFEADNPRYSYAKTDEHGMVTETAEKKVISNHAITGAYYVASTETFIKAADAVLQQKRSAEMPEYYVSHIYNSILAQGGSVQAAPVEAFASFGTPEELAEYEAKK
jgi:NDP-sugar pyrophosphorylase family protein